MSAEEIEAEMSEMLRRLQEWIAAADTAITTSQWWQQYPLGYVEVASAFLASATSGPNEPGAEETE